MSDLPEIKKCNCELCKMSPLFERIAAKCTEDEKKVLDLLYVRMEGAEIDLVLLKVEYEKVARMVADHAVSAAKQIAARDDQIQRAIHVIQTYQPGGSPPLGDWVVLLGWVLRELAEAKKERDGLRLLARGLVDDVDKYADWQPLKDTEVYMWCTALKAVLNSQPPTLTEDTGKKEE